MFFRSIVVIAGFFFPISLAFAWTSTSPAPGHPTQAARQVGNLILADPRFFHLPSRLLLFGLFFSFSATHLPSLDITPSLVGESSAFRRPTCPWDRTSTAAWWGRASDAPMGDKRDIRRTGKIARPWGRPSNRQQRQTEKCATHRLP